MRFWGKVQLNMTIEHQCHYFCEFLIQSIPMERWESGHTSDVFSWSHLSNQRTCRPGYEHLVRWVGHKGKFPRAPSLVRCHCTSMVPLSHSGGERAYLLWLHINQHWSPIHLTVIKSLSFQTTGFHPCWWEETHCLCKPMEKQELMLSWRGQTKFSEDTGLSSPNGTNHREWAGLPEVRALLVFYPVEFRATPLGEGALSPGNGYLPRKGKKAILETRGRSNDLIHCSQRKWKCRPSFLTIKCFKTATGVH